MRKDATLTRMIVPNRRVVVIYEAQSLPTRIEAVERDEFSMADPFGWEVDGGIREGDPVEMFVSTEDGVMIRFMTRVRGRRRGLVPLLMVAWPLEYERIQRRKYVRVHDRVAVAITFTPRGEDAPAQTWECVTEDVGGGGVQLRLEGLEEGIVSAGMAVSLSVELSDGRPPLRVDSTVARVCRAEGATPALLVGVEFLELSEHQRARLYRRIYSRQIELRQKGLL